MAALVDPSAPNDFQGQFCGASLIRVNWVVTAAHCVTSDSGTVLNTSLFRVVLGKLRLSDSGGEHFSVEQIAVHPSYNPRTEDNDIALIQLAGNSAVTPIVLARPENAAQFATGDDATVTGWGLTSDGGTASDTLQQVTISILSNGSCSSVYSSFTGNMLCAGVLTGGKDSCQGDSGGPLMVGDASNSSLLQAGIVSFGRACAAPNQPGVYTRVANYKTWVESQVGTSEPLPTFTPTSHQYIPSVSKNAPR
jgi:secreted trypsin-like serine protease